jgi:hypothetical protein
MSKSHIETLKQLASSENYNSVTTLISSVLYLADRVEQLEQGKQDKPSVVDEELTDQMLTRSKLQRLAMEIISAAGEDRNQRTRIYKALHSLQ